MVAISRVFDIEGLWEVLGEVGRDPSPSHDPINVHVTASNSDGRAYGGNVKFTVMPEIADSQEEGLTPEEDNAPSPKLLDGHEDQRVEIIIVDSMADIINELFARKEKSEGISLPFNLNLL